MVSFSSSSSSPSSSTAGPSSAKVQVRSAKEKSLSFLVLLLIPSFVTVFMGVYDMRQHGQAFKEDPNMPQLSDLLYGLTWSFVIVYFRYHISKAFQPLGRKILAPHKCTNQDRIERFGTVCFKLIFYLCISCMGFYVMYQEKWFPKELGGQGNAALVYSVLQEAPSFALKHYFLLQWGYHLHSLLYMLWLSPIRNDFLEMFLHHVATVVLIAATYLANYTANGSLVVFTHDLGDVAGYAIKSVVDTNATSLVVVLYFALLCTWIYTRLYVYPFHFLYNTFFIALDDQMSFFFHRAMNVMLSMLQVLHVYWFILFLQMGYRLVSKGIQEDIQQKCIQQEEGEEDQLTTNTKQKSNQHKLQQLTTTRRTRVILPATTTNVAQAAT